MRFDILSIFPEMFDCYFRESIIKRAIKKDLLAINIHNIRDFAADKHKSVDARPYGGGPGMVMMVEPIYRAVKSLKLKEGNQKSRVILLSVVGKQFDSKMAKKFSKLNQLVFICGRYEGVDERVAKYIADEEISVGPYILTGGELAAMTVIDATARFIPGVIRKESLEENRGGGYPVYTRPESFSINGKLRKTPKVLLSGNHKEIEKWRKNQISN